MRVRWRCWRKKDRKSKEPCRQTINRQLSLCRGKLPPDDGHEEDPGVTEGAGAPGGGGGGAIFASRSRGDLSV